MVIIIVVLLFKHYIVAPIRVVGPSMKDTLQDGDIMLLNKITYRFKNINRFDIVVVNYKEESKPIIKRVIGLPGDKVEVRKNKLYINDSEYDEFYLASGTNTDSFDLNSLFGEETIPEGYYFVMGDNREESKDSRTIGFIKKSNIIGKASLTLFPFDRIGKKH